MVENARMCLNSWLHIKEVGVTDMVRLLMFQSLCLVLCVGCIMSTILFIHMCINNNDFLFTSNFSTIKIIHLHIVFETWEKVLFSFIFDFLLKQFFINFMKAIKKNFDKLDFIKIKDICMNQHHWEGEKIIHRLGRTICKSYIW